MKRVNLLRELLRFVMLVLLRDAKKAGSTNGEMYLFGGIARENCYPGEKCTGRGHFFSQNPLPPVNNQGIGARREKWRGGG